MISAAVLWRHVEHQLKINDSMYLLLLLLNYTYKKVYLLGPEVH